LTTHYLEEADILSDYLTIMDHGKIVAEGTPRELKRQISGDAVIIKPKQEGKTNRKNSKYVSNLSFVKIPEWKGSPFTFTSKMAPRLYRRSFLFWNLKRLV